MTHNDIQKTLEQLWDANTLADLAGSENSEGIQNLLKECLSIDCGAIQVLTKRGNISGIRFLCALGADIDYVSDDTNKAALAIAASNGQYDLTRAILDLGANVNKRSGKEHQTALYYAALSGHVKIVQQLIDNGSEKSIEVVEAAAIGGSNSIIKLLIESDFPIDKIASTDSSPTSSLNSRKTPLAYALSNYHHDIVETLLEAGVCVDMTSINIALKTGQMDLVVRLREIFGQSPSVNSLSSDCPSISADLSDEYIEEEDELNVSLPYAVKSGNIEAIELALNQSTDIDGSAKKVIKHGSDSAIRYILKRHRGFAFAALEAAIQMGKSDIVKLVLDESSNEFKVIKNCFPKYIDDAINLHDVDSIQLLLDAGFAINHDRIPELFKMNLQRIPEAMNVSAIPANKISECLLNSVLNNNEEYVRFLLDSKECRIDSETIHELLTVPGTDKEIIDLITSLL